MADVKLEVPGSSQQLPEGFVWEEKGQVSV
jgi:hypothetical protein